MLIKSNQSQALVVGEVNQCSRSKIIPQGGCLTCLLMLKYVKIFNMFAVL